MTASPFVHLSKAAVRHEDARGHLDVLFEQDNVVLKRSFSRAGVFRGMHWQRPPFLQTKLIRVVRGRILDFVVDPTSADLRLHRSELASSHGWVVIGAHLAHGFFAREDTEFEYLCLGAYNASAEQSYSIAGFISGTLGLRDVTYSAKDAAAPHLAVSVGDYAA